MKHFSPIRGVAALGGSAWTGADQTHGNARRVSITFQEAMLQLDQARRDNPSPCEAAPETWEPRRTGGYIDSFEHLYEPSEPLKDFNYRLLVARKACFSECPVLWQCRTVLQSLDPKEPEATGIIAGILVNHPSVSLKNKERQ
jgi:hypothetical protein